MIVLAVKPQFYESVITEIKDKVTEDKIVITIAPGKTLAWLEEKFGKKVKIVRTMPNTPAMVMEGMTAASPNPYLSEEEVKYACHILESFGKVEVIPERLMDAVVSVSGSSPAYVFILIEAMADAAVADGMPRPQAYKFAAQAVMGSAKMVLESGKKRTIIIEGGTFGGQITSSPNVENYPGIASVSGSEFSMNLLDQAMKLGAETQMAQVTGIRDEGEVKVIVTPKKNIRAGVLF